MVKPAGPYLDLVRELKSAVGTVNCFDGTFIYQTIESAHSDGCLPRFWRVRRFVPRSSGWSFRTSNCSYGNNDRIQASWFVSSANSTIVLTVRRGFNHHHLLCSGTARLAWRGKVSLRVAEARLYLYLPFY